MWSAIWEKTLRRPEKQYISEHWVCLVSLIRSSDGFETPRQVKIGGMFNASAPAENNQGIAKYRLPLAKKRGGP